MAIESLKANHSSGPERKRLRLWLLGGLAACGLANAAFADTVSFSGQILQSTQDGTGPAMNNLSLNNILDLQNYLVTLTFSGSITAPGTYDLTGANLTFSDPAAAASETAFGPISLTVSANGGFDDLSLLGCLTTGSGCAFGNQLDANFQIAAASLNSQNVAATGLDQPHPLDLLEDDGITDIQGSVTNYSYVPEPSTLIPLGGVLVVLSLAGRRMRLKSERRRKQ